MPGGDWQSTCRNACVQGGMLHARCNDGYGTWVQTSFDMARSPNAVLTNVRGVLVNQNSPNNR